jgi:GTP-binding protein
LLKELGSYSEDLARKKRLLVGTKTDLPETEGRLEELKAKYPDEEILGVSVFSGEGIKELSYAFLRLVKTGDDDNVADGANMNEGQFQFEGEDL